MLLSRCCTDLKLSPRYFSQMFKYSQVPMINGLILIFRWSESIALFSKTVIFFRTMKYIYFLIYNYNITSKVIVYFIGMNLFIVWFSIIISWTSYLVDSWIIFVSPNIKTIYEPLLHCNYRSLLRLYYHLESKKHEWDSCTTLFVADSKSFKMHL